MMERIDLSVMRGETFLRTVRIREAGQPVDLSGYTARCQIRETPDGGVLICEMGAVTDAAEGCVELIIPADVTAGMESGTYAYDFRMDAEDGVRSFWFGGLFRVYPSVTE